MNPSSFEAIWGLEVAATGYVMVPKCLVQCQKELGIKSCELNTLIHLLSYHYGHRNPYPSRDKVGKSAEKAPGTIQRHVRSLEAQGLIERVYRTGTSNEYSFDRLRDELILHTRTCTRRIQKQIPPLSNNEQPLYSKTDNTPSKAEYQRRPPKKTKKNKTNETHVANANVRHAPDLDNEPVPDVGYRAFQEAGQRLRKRHINNV